MEHTKDFDNNKSDDWLEGSGLVQDAKTRGGRRSFKSSGGGYAVGMDKQGRYFTDGIAMGQQFSNLRPDAENRALGRGRISQESTLLGLYGSYQLPRSTQENAYIFSGYLSYARVDNHSHRGLSSQQDDPDERYRFDAQWSDDVFAMGMAFTWVHHMGRNAYVAPLISLEYTHARMGSFDEYAYMRYSDGSFANFSATVGASIYRTWEVGRHGTITPTLSLAYVGDLVRKNGKCRVSDFTGGEELESAVRYGRNAVQVRALVDWHINERWGARAGYTFEARKSLNSQVADLSINRLF